MSGLMDRLSRFSGDPAQTDASQPVLNLHAVEHRPQAPSRQGPLPTPAMIAKLREKLERAAREKDVDAVRDAMDDVVALLGRVLPRALAAPPPFPKQDGPSGLQPSSLPPPAMKPQGWPSNWGTGEGDRARLTEGEVLDPARWIAAGSRSGDKPGSKG